MCALPLVAWLTRNWFYLGLIGSLPGFLLLLCYNIIPPSPRWLSTQNRLVEASLILEKVARTNGRGTTLKSTDILKMLIILKSKKQGITGSQGWQTLFSKKTLAMHTIMLTISYSMNLVVYFGIAINTTNLSGNQFLDFFILAVVEFPAAWLVVILTPRVGRRWPNTFSFGSGFVVFGIVGICSQIQTVAPILPLIFFAKYVVLFRNKCFTGLELTSKFFFLILTRLSCAILTMIFSLQTFEMFPTPLRATGLGFVIMVGNVASIVSPFIVFLVSFLNRNYDLVNEIQLTRTSPPREHYILPSCIGLLASSR